MADTTAAPENTPTTPQREGGAEGAKREKEEGEKGQNTETQRLLPSAKQLLSSFDQPKSEASGEPRDTQNTLNAINDWYRVASPTLPGLNRLTFILDFNHFLCFNYNRR